MTKRQKIDAAREIRLWLGQVIVPTVTTVGLAMTVPEVRAGIKEKYNQIRWKLKNRK